MNQEHSQESEVGRYYALPPRGSSIQEIAAFMKKQMKAREAFLARQDELRKQTHGD